VTTALDDLVCPDCGYSLRGVEQSERCPECGWRIDRTASAAQSRIPWVHRRDIGRIRAYLRTVALSTWRIKELAQEVARPVDDRAGRRFATVTAILASVPVVAILLNAMARYGPNVFNPSDADTFVLSRTIPAQADAVLPFAAGVTLWPIPPLASVLTLWLITRVPAMWFAPEGGLSEQRRQRAEALSYYTSAPLLFIPWAAIIYLGADELRRLSSAWMEIAFTLRLFAVCLAALGLLAAWLNPILLLRRTTHASGLRMLATAIGMPITWCLCAAVGSVVMPWVVGYVWLMIDSVRA
jgi:hypothetical protein